MKKKLFFRLCLILTVYFTAYSCRQDLLPEKETYHNTSAFQLTSKRISLNESKHKAKLLPELGKAEAELKTFSKTNAQGKVVSYANGVSIDTDNVTYIENGPNFHTYTFNLTKDNALPTDPVENLVLSPLTDGTYRELLVSYNLTAQERQTLMSGGSVNTTGKTTITELATGTYAPLSKGMASCGWQETYTMMGCSDVHDGVSTHNSSNTETWGSCTADRKPGLYMTMVYDCKFIYDENDNGGGSWPGSGSGDDNGGGTQIPVDGTEPCNGNGVATNPLDPNTNIGEGGCAGVVTMPTLPSTHDPCWNIKTNFANAKFKEKVTAIDKPEVFDYDHEMGYAAGYPPSNTGVTGTQYPPMENTLGTHYVTLPDGNQYFGFIHSHTNREGAVKIFSHADLATFLMSCVPNADANGNIGDAYAMVITSQGNYILKYTGLSSTFGVGVNTQKIWKAWFEERLREIQNEDNTFDQNKLEKVFLRFLKEKVKIDGIQLYEVEKITGKAKELALDANNNVIPTPCD